MDTTSTSEKIDPIGQQQLEKENWTTGLPPPKLPCGGLLGNRDDYNNICAPLYNASFQGNWEAAQVIFEKHQDLDLVGYGISENYDTALHIAASAKSSKLMEKFVQKLVDMMTMKQLELQSKNYNTALCLAAASGNLNIVMTMLKKNPTLVDIPGNRGMMPLYMASLYGKHDMVNYLYDNSNKMNGEYWTDQNRGLVLMRCTEANLFDVALKIVTDRPELTANGSVLGVLAQKTDAFRGIKSHFIWRIISQIIGQNIGPTEKPSDAMRLLRIMWTNIVKLPKATIDDIIRGPPDIIIGGNGKENPKYSSQILFVAAEMGNIEFLVELIRQYPDLMWRKNDNNQTIIHVAVSHRHEDIYSLVHEIGSMKDTITSLTDVEGNNMLHLVGKSAKKNRLKMQHELLWFKEVEELMPPCYRERKNKDGLTPHVLFIEEHKDMFVINEKWMKDTANQCLVVAALIASIGFAAAITVPGGYNQSSGIPIFLHKLSFIVFAISDAISLILSTTSILMFLSIFISRHGELDFMEPLPRKMMNGLATLFYSITAMLVGFSVSFFLLYQDKLIWVPISISVLISVPVIFYARDQYDLARSAFVSTYGSRYLFRPKKLRLYYQNPRF